MTCPMPPLVTARLQALLVAMSLAGSAPALSAATTAEEVRGLWVVRTALVSPEAVDRVVDDAAAAGFNTLLVQVRARGDAFYRSRLVPRSPLLERQPPGFDPLARLLERARSRGLHVHGWVNVLLVAHFGQPLPAGHILASRPEWAMVPRSAAAPAWSAVGGQRLALIQAAGRREGDVEGFYLAPSEPAVGAHLEAVVRELVRGYPLDGLHLDYIRYPGQTFDYGRSALEGFRDRVAGGAGLLAAPERDPAAWDRYRREQVDALTARLADAARAERPGILTSAAVVPDEAQALNHKFQNWPGWLEAGVLAAVCPMVYTPESRLFQQQVEAALQKASGRPVWAGVGAYRLDPAGVVEKVSLARQTGAAGVVIFSHESLLPEHLRALRERAFAPLLPAGRGGAAAGAR